MKLLFVFLAADWKSNQSLDATQGEGCGQVFENLRTFSVTEADEISMTLLHSRLLGCE
jgi:hypothetical protein